MRSSRINRPLLICLALVVPEHADQVRPSEAKIIYKWFIILPSDSSVWHWFNKHWCISSWKRSAIFHFPDLLSLLSPLSVELWHFSGNAPPPTPSISAVYSGEDGALLLRRIFLLMFTERFLKRKYCLSSLRLGADASRPRLLCKRTLCLIKFRQSALIIHERIQQRVTSTVRDNN